MAVVGLAFELVCLTCPARLFMMLSSSFSSPKALYSISLSIFILDSGNLLDIGMRSCDLLTIFLHF
jgi:hypothetical protein